MEVKNEVIHHLEGDQLSDTFCFKPFTSRVKEELGCTWHAHSLERKGDEVWKPLLHRCYPRNKI